MVKFITPLFIAANFHSKKGRYVVRMDFGVALFKIYSIFAEEFD